MKGRIGIAFYNFIGILLVAFLWVVGNYISPETVPGFSQVLRTIHLNFWDIYWINTLVTAKTSFVALVLSFIVSSILVLIVAIYPRFELIISPMLLLIKATPVVAFIPLIISLYGMQIESRILAALLVCSFPLIIAGIDGMKRLPKKLVILAKVYNGSRMSVYYHLYLQFILESMFSSLKIAAPLSLVGTMVAEFLIGGDKAGLGCFLASNMSPTGMVSRYATIIFSSILGLVFYLIAYFIHKYHAKSSNINK